MSNPISAIWQDVRLEDIRNTVRTKTGSIPFLLMPVRIETRFMEVEKKAISDDTSLASILNFFVQLQVEVIDLVNKTSAITSAEINAVNTDIVSLADAIAKIEIVFTKEKSWLLLLHKELDEDIAAVLKKTTVSPATTKTNLGNLKIKIDNLKVQKEEISIDAHRFIEQMRAIQNKLLSLNNPRKTPFINVKNKKDLYSFTEKTLKETLDFYKNASQNSDKIKSIFKNQTARIILIHQAVKAELDKIIISLTKIHDDTNWRTFVNRTATEQVALIKRQFVAFERLLLPKFQRLPQPVLKFDERDIHFHGIQTLTYLKRFNSNKNVAKFDTTKAIQKRLSPRMDTLNTKLGETFKVSESRSPFLKKIYEDIQTQILASKTQIDRFRPINNSQKAGISVIKNFIDNNVSTTISGVINSVATPVTITSQKQHELWVRIYPDDIFVQTHDEALTEQEVVAGKDFWKNWWVSTNNNELELASFRGLTRGCGIRRAAWIVRSLDPRKVNSPKNTNSLKNKPSLRTNTVIKQLEEITARLQPFTSNLIDKKPEKAISAIDPLVFNTLTTRLNETHRILKIVKIELNFVMQQLQTALMRLGSGLNLLIEKRNNLREESLGNLLRPKLDALEMLVNAFNPIPESAYKIEALPFDLFSKKLNEPFDYPAVITKNDVWAKAPQTNMLPDRFVVITIQNNNYSHVIVGNKVPSTLQIGLNPTSEEDNVFHLDENGDLQIDEKLLWMTEYSEALKVGMAISVPLTDQQAQDGFDQVFVLGIKDLDPAQSQQSLTKLIQNHIYSPDGMAFLKVGTPTNNTHQDSAGFKPENDLEKIFNSELKEPPARRKYIGDTDADRLQRFLGLTDSELNRVVDSNNTQISDSIVMNRALWGATLGHFMEEMWDGVFTYDNIARTERFFTENVVGRGFLPSIRVGEQPYGILPTTAFSQFKLYTDDTVPKLFPSELKTLNPAILESRLQKRFDLRLAEIIKTLRKIWEGFTVIHSDILNNGQGQNEYQKRYMNMLGLHATSLQYNVRYGVNVGKGPQLDTQDPNSVATNFSTKDAFGPSGFFELFKDLMFEGVFSQSFVYLSEEKTQLNFKDKDIRYNEILHHISNSRVFISRFLDRHPVLKGNTVDKLPISDKPLSNDYIDWLLKNHPNAILGSNKWANLPDKSLLFMLLRQSLMQTYQEAALAILQTEGTLSEFNRRSLGSSSEYLTYDYNALKRLFSTKWHYLMKNLKDLRGMRRINADNNPFYTYMAAQNPANSAMNSYVFFNSDSVLKNPLFLNYSQRANHQKHLEKVDEIREAFRTLAKIPTKELDILLAEHIDLNTHRLDAWQLGFVNRRLKQHRIISPTGIYLGAFGWVENLRPDKNRKVKTDDTIPEELKQTGSKIYEDPDNQGFIHAPSIHHGITAAILRAGYLADKKASGAGSRLSVNLTSERVRMALSIISGLKNGLDLGAILGFQFERGLHERYNLGVELDQYIQPFRKQYPLVDIIEDTADGKKAAYQSQVIHGLKLLEEAQKAVDWFNNNTEKTLEDLLVENNFAKCPAFIKNLSGINDAKKKAIIKEIDRIADSLDALGDLVMSEGVYQIVKGNHVRAAAALASISPNQRTATSVPDPEIIETPRTGTVVTHRVLLSLPVKNVIALPASWGNLSKSPRAEAEPSLNFWLANLLGEPSKIGCEVIIRQPNLNEQSLFINLKYLGWQPIDYFYNAIDETSFLQKIALIVRKKENFDDTAQILPQLKSKASGRSFYEVDWLISQIRAIFNGAKFAGDHDCLGANQQPENDLNTGSYDATQYLNRAQNAYQSLLKIITDIEGIAKIKKILDGIEVANQITLTAAEITQIHTILDQLTNFSIDNTIPEAINPTELQKITLIRQIITAHKESKKRITEADNQLNSIVLNTAPQVIVEKASEAIKAIFSKGFLAMPQFKASNFTEMKPQLNNAFDDSKGLLRHNKTLVIEKWLQGIAKVREKMYATEMLIAGTESLNSIEINCLPTQLPFLNGDYWLGVEYPDTHTPTGDKLSITLINPENFGDTNVGILVDEWVEILPNKSETTGLTFHYNQPNSMPPQSILLAVNPEESNRWSWDNLVYTLRDTLALAKLRAVEPDHLYKSSLAQVLPTIMAEVVPGEVKDDDGNALGVQVALDFINNNQI